MNETAKPIGALYGYSAEDFQKNRSWFLALGILLITASAFGYSLMQHAALLIPAIMGAALLFYGLKAVQVCRSRSVSDNHQHQRNGAMG